MVTQQSETSSTERAPERTVPPGRMNPSFLIDGKPAAPSTSIRLTGSQAAIPETRMNTTSTDDHSDLKKILPPTIILGVILLGLAIWFGRRQVKTNRRRRMARHFEIDNTEDGGEGGSSSGSGRSGISRAFAGLMGNRGWGRQSDNGGLPKPFGGVKVPDEDAPNPRRLQNTMSVLYGNLRGGQPADLADQIFPMAGGGGEQAMAQAGGRGASQPITARAPAAGRWEEVDFGLGRVDQANRASRPPALLNGLGISSGNQPLGSTPPPLLVVQPPTQPHTPNGDEFNRLSAYPTMIPEPSPTIRQLRTVANVTGRDQEGTPRTEWSTTSSPLAAQQLSLIHI